MILCHVCDYVCVYSTAMHKNCTGHMHAKVHVHQHWAWSCTMTELDTVWANVTASGTYAT